MGMAYCLIKEDYNFIHSFEEQFGFNGEQSFLSGKWIDLKIEEPLIVKIKCPKDESPAHFLDGVVPIYSGAMVEQFRLAGIDNFQIFPVVLINDSENIRWDNYFALNALGLLDAINVDESVGSEIMLGDMDDGIPPLLDFNKIVIDPSKTNGALMFREVRSPDILIFDYKIVDFLKKATPLGGWKIKIKKLESRIE